jgi:hypothetical protein
MEGAEEYQTVSVFDMTGRMVIHQELNNKSALNVSELQAGVYLIRLDGNGGPHVSKLIKR